ncbi:hypothetical protein HDR61_00125 [bacterium]|nr:hypothetical protein [bacterium]
MRLNLVKNPDAAAMDKYEIARAIYAEGGGGSLRAASALASMVANAAIATSRTPIDIVRDIAMFSARDKKSPRHNAWHVHVNDAGFQMCLRVVNAMLKQNLGDYCNGATNFHHEDEMPDWAIARGYIAECDGILFYA